MNNNNTTSPTASFKEHFNTLRTIADKLQNSNQEPDIDALVEDVKKATEAYQICKDRLNAAKKVLESHLAKVEPTELQTQPAKVVNNSNGFENDDIPF